MSDYGMNSKEFFIALEEGHLIGTRCKKCGAYAVPHRQICAKCHSTDTEIVQFSGKGKLAAYTVISVPPVMMANAGYDARNPYCTGIVELEEGPRIAAQILGLNLAEPEKIRIGMPLTMTTITRTEGEVEKTFLAFQPA